MTLPEITPQYNVNWSRSENLATVSTVSFASLMTRFFETLVGFYVGYVLNSWFVPIFAVSGDCFFVSYLGLMYVPSWA